MIVDVLGNSFSPEDSYERIVSLVPSTTETLFALGMGENVVGVTRFCVHPESVRKEKILIGGTKQLDRERVLDCQADLVLGNQEENSPEIYQQLQELQLPSCFFFPKTVEQAIADIASLGRLFQKQAQYEDWLKTLQYNRQRCKRKNFRFAYAIWRDPWMFVNDDCFIASMLREIGGENVLGQHPERYCSLPVEELLGYDVDVLLLSSEPFPFREKHIKELVERGFRREQIRLIDGEMCSWHGTRMAMAFAYFSDWLQGV